MLCVEFSQVQCIDLSKVVKVLKAVAIVTSEHLNLLTFLWTVTFWMPPWIPWMEVKCGFWDPGKVSLSPEQRCPFNRGTPATTTKIMWKCFWDQIWCHLTEGVPWIEVSQRRGYTVIVKDDHTHRNEWPLQHTSLSFIL